MFLLIVQIVEHKADLLMFVLIVLEFWSLSQGHRLTGDIKCVQVRQVSELVLPADVSVVGSEGHQEVDEGENDQGARHRRQDEHHLCPLHVVNAELLHLKLAFYQQVFFLSICGEKEVQWVEIDDPITVPVPLNLVCAADPPTECVEGGHNNTTGKN